MATGFTDISTDNGETSSTTQGSEIITVDDDFPSTMPKPTEEDLLRQRLIIVSEEKDALAAQLTSMLRYEIESSLTSADSIARPSDQNGEKFVQKAMLDEALAKAQELFNENTALKMDIAAAKVEIQDKKRLEAEVARIKAYWSSFNSLGAVASVGRIKKEVPTAAASTSVSPSIDVRRDDSQPLKEEISKLKTQIKTIQDAAGIESERLKKQMENISLEKASVIGEMQNFQSEIIRLNNVNDGLNNELAAANHTRQALEGENQRLSMELHQFVTIANGLENAVQVNRQMSDTVDRLNRDLTFSHQQLQKGAEDLTKKEAECGRLLQENRRLRDEAEKMKASFATLEGDNHLLQGENYVAKKELENEQRKAADRDDTIFKYQMALKKNAADVAKLKADLENIKQEWQKSVQEISAVLWLQQNPLDAPWWANNLAHILARQKSNVAQHPESADLPMDTSEAQTSQCEQQINQLVKEKDSWREKYQNLTDKIQNLNPKGRSYLSQSLKRTFSGERKQNGTGKDTIKESQKGNAPGVAKENAQMDSQKGNTPGVAKDNAQDKKDSSKGTKPGLIERQKKFVSLQFPRLKQFMEQQIVGKSEDVTTVYKAADSVWNSVSGLVAGIIHENTELNEDVRTLRRSKGFPFTKPVVPAKPKKKPSAESGGDKSKKLESGGGGDKVKKPESGGGGDKVKKPESGGEGDKVKKPGGGDKPKKPSIESGCQKPKKASMENRGDKMKKN